MSPLPGQEIYGQIEKAVLAVEAEHAIDCQGWRMVNGLSGKAMQDDSERGQWISMDDFSKVFPIEEINRTDRLSAPAEAGDWLLYIWRK